MLPSIETKSAIKNTMTLSTTNITKNNPTTSYYNKIKPTSKDYSTTGRNLDTYKNKNSNNVSRKSKIMNNSTNNNSTNNSNFYENLYYYPAHNSKYSYVNNISSEVCLLYSDFNFNKAPSLRQNVSDIRKMINKRKRNKIKYLNNLFYSSITGNKQSQTNNNDDFYEDKKKDIKLLSQNLYSRNKPERNNSCIEFKKTMFKDKDEPLNNKNFMNTNSNKNSKLNINRYTNSGCISTTTYKTINSNKLPDMSKDNIRYNLNSGNEKSESKSNNIYSNTIKEFTHLPNISKPQNKSIDDEIPKINNTNINNKSSFLTNLNTEQMGFIINDCIYESKEKIKKINEFEIKIYQMKLFQGFQKNQLNILLDKEIYSVEKYINHIEKTFRKYTRISKKYNTNFQEYLKYLRELLSDMDSQLKYITNQHIQLEYDVDNLLNKNINKQKELERLIDMRNFLFRVKHKDEKIPISDINSTLLVESKKYALAKCLSKLFENDNNITVIKFLNNLPGKIPDLTNLDESKYKFIVKNCPPLLPNNNILIITDHKTKYKKIGIKKKKKKKKLEEMKNNVFSEPEEIIEIIKFLEDQNRFLLKQNENKRILIEKYKDDLENCIPQEEIDIEKKIIAEVIVKERELSKLKQQYNILTEKYKYIFNVNSKNDVFKLEPKKPKKSEAGKSSFADFNYFQTINYNFQIKKAKYPGMVFFGKLLKCFLNFLSMNYDSFNKKKFYTHISPDYLNEILEHSEKMNFNEKNYYLIYEYIIKLLKLYEYICDYVFKKDVEYNSNEKNIPIIKRENDKIGNKRKLDNARTIRMLIENKRINANKQLIEKWLKPEKYISRKVDNNNYKILLRNKSQDDMIKTKKYIKINNELNDEINGFIEIEE